MAQIRKAPDIAKSNAESHLSQKILDFTVPPCSSGRLRRVLLAFLTGVGISLELCGPFPVIISWQRLLLHLREEGTGKRSMKIVTSVHD